MTREGFGWYCSAYPWMRRILKSLLPDPEIKTSSRRIHRLIQDIKFVKGGVGLLDQELCMKTTGWYSEDLVARTLFYSLNFGVWRTMSRNEVHFFGNYVSRRSSKGSFANDYSEETLGRELGIINATTRLGYLVRIERLPGVDEGEAPISITIFSMSQVDLELFFQKQRRRQQRNNLRNLRR